MEIKPVKLIKSVTGSSVGPELDVVHKPKTPAPVDVPALPEGLEFNGRQMHLGGRDVGELIVETAQQNPVALGEIAAKLEEYKNTRLKKRNQLAKKGNAVTAEDEELSLIWAVCDAHIARIGQLIKRRYDQTKDGITVFFDDDGQLVLNGINVTAFIESCRQNPGSKTKTLLRGLRTRLGYILHNRNNNPYYIQIRDVVLELHDEIQNLLRSMSA